MSANLVRVSHNGQVKTVALFDGLPTDELNNVLQSIFSLSSNVIGFLAEVTSHIKSTQKSMRLYAHASNLIFLSTFDMFWF